jgi:DNA-binding HxlR family transcriptional regulator
MTDTENTPIVDYTDKQLFDGVIDNIEAYTNRLDAVADPRRLSIVYTVYEHDEITHEKLTREAPELNDETLNAELKQLLNMNIIAKIPSPRGDKQPLTYYRITRIGKDIIENIIRLREDEQVELHYNTRSDENVWTNEQPD